MVTLKRKAKSESGRVGGYATNMSSSMNNYDRYQTSKQEEKGDVIRAEFYDDSPQYKDYLWKEFNRTSSRPILSPDQVKNGVKPEDVQRQESKYRSTYSYSGYASTYAIPKSNAFASSRDEQEAHGITFKAKMMIVAYVAVVVFFLTLIVINAGTLASLKSDLMALAAAESNMNTELTQPVVPSEPVVEEVQMSGVESSLKNAVYAGDYTLMSVGTPQRYEGNTSWFDSVCDWLGSVIGG